jgi:hypothetical protein
MTKRLKYTLLLPLVVLLAYVLLVQVLRNIAMGEEEREALALMEPLPPPPEGDSGFRYLAFTDLEIPATELEAALAREVAAFTAWEESAAGAQGGQGAAGFESPAAARYPARARVAPPDQACRLGDLDCLETLRGEEASIRDWLARDGERLALAEQALRADTLANPFPLGNDTPMPAYQVLRLPLNAVVLQALDGDAAGALARACQLLASSRRFLRQDGWMIDKMANAVMVDALGATVLSLRRANPEMALPAGCETALAAVEPSDYLLCGAAKTEQALLGRFLRRQDEALASSSSFRDWVSRRLLTDADLMRGWSAAWFAPLCSEAGLALIATGKAPVLPVREYRAASIDSIAAPVSHILFSIQPPDYAQYQQRLLDYAAKLRLHLAAIAVAEGRLAADEVPAIASSPGYPVLRQGDEWVVALSEGRRGGAPERRIAVGSVDSNAR